MEQVTIEKCNDYQYSNVEKAVFCCLDGIPEIKQKIKHYLLLWKTYNGFCITFERLPD